MNPRHAGLIMAGLSAALFGSNIVSAQIAGAAGLSGPLLVLWRVVMMLAGGMLAMVILRERLSLAPGQWRPILIFSLASAFVGSAYLSSVAFIPVTVAVVLLYLFPIFIVIAEPFVRGTPFGRDRFVLAMIALAGIVLVVGPAFDRLDPRGLALALLSAAAAASQFFAGNDSAKTPLATKLVVVHLIVLPITIGILIVTGGLKSPMAIMAAPWAAAITMFAFVLGFTLQVMALKRLDAAAAGLMFCLEPVIAALFAAWWLGERLTALQYLGAALVVGTVVANVLRESRSARG
jgi:drug/metabolite transporter (DMT)-like permease